MTNMSLADIVQPTIRPSEMTIEGIAAASMSAVLLQLESGWTTSFGCGFNEQGAVNALWLADNADPDDRPDFGYSVEYVNVEHVKVCLVHAWADLWHQTLSGLVDGKTFLPFWEEPPAYWVDTLEQFVSAADASTDLCN
jgi:hypothetical protein